MRGISLAVLGLGLEVPGTSLVCTSPGFDELLLVVSANGSWPFDEPLIDVLLAEVPADCSLIDVLLATEVPGTSGLAELEVPGICSAVGLAAEFLDWPACDSAWASSEAQRGSESVEFSRS